VIAVTPGYFKSLGMPILAGRDFSDSDGAGGALVVVVNAAFAQQYFPDQDPIGRRIRWQMPDTAFQWRTVAGVVIGSRHEDLSKTAVAEVFAPFDQLPLNWLTVTLRAAVPAESLVPFVREQVRAIDREQPLYDVSTMEERVGRTLRDRRLETLLLGSFAALALLLAAAGVYGVMSYSVSQSRREIGVRMALGATPGGVTAEVLRRALGLSVAGLVAGLIAAWYLTRFLASFLYGIGPKDPIIFSLAPVLLLMIALLASYLPARRAARVDPVEALRAE
jgi:putative ABC transport system permease protein